MSEIFSQDAVNLQNGNLRPQMDYLEIKGYKSIKSARIDFRAINVLIGANGSGKSNFLSFFDVLNIIYNRNFNLHVSLAGGPDKVLYGGIKKTNSLKILTEFNEGLNGYRAEIRSSPSGFVFADERIIYKGNDNANIARSDTESRITETDNYRAKYLRKFFEGFRKYHFHDTSKESPFTKYSDVGTDIYYLYSNGSNLAAFLFFIREKNVKVYTRIIKTIQSIAPYFSDFYLRPNNQGKLQLLWKDKYDDVLFGANDLSDGTLRFIALTTLFLQPTLPQTIIIDEPELGLHPVAISKLSGMIKSAASRKCQIVIATQSADLISYFDPEDILTVDQVQGESVFKRLREKDLKKWLDSYTVDALWRQNMIAGQPNYDE